MGKINQIFAVVVSIALIYDSILAKFLYNAELSLVYSLLLPKLYHIAVSTTRSPYHRCFKNGGCKQNQLYRIPICYCDSACIQYEDCCYDASPNVTSPSMDPLHAKKEYLDCEDNFFYIKYFGIWVVSKCPMAYEFSEISDKCTSRTIRHPVSADDGTVYRNVYCAVCHNVSQYTAWQFEFYDTSFCPINGEELLNMSIPEKINYIIENNCQYDFIPAANAQHRSCFKNVIRDNTENALCQKFQNPLLFQNSLYRNVYCLNEDTETTVPICITSVKKQHYTSRSFSQLVLTGIFNIHPVVEWFGSKRCQDDRYTYNINTDTCVPQTCMVEKQKSDTCQVQLIKNFQWTKLLTFIIDNTINSDFILRLASFVSLSFPVDIYDMVFGALNGVYRCGTNVTDGVRPCCTGYIAIEFKNHGSMTEEDTLRFETEAMNMRWNYQEIHDETMITAIDVIGKSNLNLSDTCNVTGKKYNTNFQTHPVYVDDKMKSLFIRNVTRHDNLIPVNVKGVVVISYRGNTPEFRLKQWTLEYKRHNQTNGTYINSQNNALSNEWSVGTILTYITLGCSCCSLMITLGIYSYYGLFTCSAGEISKHMMVTMLAAQILFIGGVGANYIRVLCTIIGIVSHYLWLCSFTWISLFMFSILEMMRKLRNCPGALVEQQRLSRVICCFGYMLPFVIVLPCALLEYLTDIDIGYSGQFCFPTGFVANLFSFTLPIITSLCFNIIALIASSIFMGRYNHTVKHLHSVRKARSLVPVYIRLSLLCAFPWILGIIASIVQIDILDYIFILLSGSHGTFVAMSFLLTKSVRRLALCNRNKTPRNNTETDMAESKTKSTT